MPDPKIVGALVSVLPEVLTFIKAFYADRGRFPTELELADRMMANKKRIIAISDKWLAENPGD